MQVAIFSKVAHEKDLSTVHHLLQVLHREGINVFFYGPYYEGLLRFGPVSGHFALFENHKALRKHKIDFFITLGGDGTILDAVTLVRDLNIPILGINLGRLGFLAGINKNRIDESIQALMQGTYTISTRKLLFLESNLPIFEDVNFALNDFTVLKRDTSSVITIHTFVNGDYLGTYWSDGIIVSTPTGSTGYSLSCGGPIVFPESNTFIITPVAPHNLNVRPIIVPDNTVLSFEIEGRSDSFLCTLDARFEGISTEHQLAVRLCDFTVPLVQLYGDNFQKTIREKLSWGRDNRN